MDHIHLLPPREQQKGLRQRLQPGKLEDMAKECRKPSPSISRAKKPLAEAEADNADDGEFNGAEVSSKPPAGACF